MPLGYMRTVGMLLAVGLALAAARPAAAQQCTFSATDVVFGTVDTVGGGVTDSVGTISINCPAIHAAVRGSISIASGSGGATASSRQMADAGTATDLDYQIYSDPAHSTIAGSGYWANGGATITFDSATDTIIGSTGTFNLYGRVGAGQYSVEIGTYLSQFTAADVVVDYETCTAIEVCTDQSGTFSFDVTAEVVADCVLSAGDLDFGTTGLLSSAVDAQSSLSVACTPGTALQLSLDNGLTGTGPTTRLMTNPNGHSIQYGLYRDAGRSLPWGDAPGIDTLADTGAGALVSVPVYGRVPAQSTPPPATYTDTVVVTMTY